MATKQKATVKNTAVVKKEKIIDENLVRVQFIIPVHSVKRNMIFQRGQEYLITQEEAKEYQGDYRLC